MAEQSPKIRTEGGAGSTGAGASGSGASSGASNASTGSAGSTGSTGTTGAKGATGAGASSTGGATTGGASMGGANTGDANSSGGSGNIRQAVTSKVASAADSQKNRAADSINSIADVARQTGEDLRDQNEMLASWVNMASDQLRTMADRLRDRPASEIAEDLSRFARERPAIFLSGAFLLGLGVARLLRSRPDQSWSTGGGNGRQLQGDYAEGGMHGSGAYPESGSSDSSSEINRGRSGDWSPSGSGAY